MIPDKLHPARFRPPAFPAEIFRYYILFSIQVKEPAKIPGNRIPLPDDSFELVQGSPLPPGHLFSRDHSLHGPHSLYSFCLHCRVRGALSLNLQLKTGLTGKQMHSIVEVDYSCQKNQIGTDKVCSDKYQS